MARPNKKHHKIPATYLAGFTDSNGKLWVGDRNFRVYAQTPKGLLTEDDYYTIKFPNGGGTILVETNFLGGLEGKYSTIYREKLSQHIMLTMHEKAELSAFIASMLQTGVTHPSLN